MSEEAELEASLELYKLQLSQVEQAVQVAGDSPDLNQLQSDLQELIKLTEDNLLQLKKARLLKALDEQTVSETSTLDDEYSAFQSSVASNVSLPSVKDTSLTDQSSSSHLATKTVLNNESNKQDSSENDDYSDEGENDGDDNSILSSLIGTKCRAPFSHEWGGHHYGNAMVWSVDPPTSDSNDYMVRVIFLNPVHPSIIPCTYFMDGKCRFSDDDCRHSHGHPVLVSELKPFVEPDHSKITEGCRCLAKSEDEVWYPGTVVDVCDDHLVNVRFDALKQECTVQVENVLPLESDSESDDDGSSDSDGAQGTSKEHDAEGSNDRANYSWKPAQITDKLGAWESHTKGIGSKLMAKMGYITGQGLGPEGTGRAEPVPIMLLPQGKSLDKIMELKEMSGNDDMFNAMKKLEKRKKLMEKKEQEQEKKKERKDNWGVFGFINNKLGDKKDTKSTSHDSQQSHKNITSSSEKELNKKSDKEVNVQIFKTAEEIKSVERHLSHLKQQLARNLSRDKKMCDSVKEKIRQQEKYLNQLKTSSQTLETHRDRRSAHKKLSMF